MSSGKPLENKNLVTGLNSVEAAIDQAGFFDSDILYVARQSDGRVRKLVQKAERSQARVEKVSYKELNKRLGSKKHQGIVLERSGGDIFLKLPVEQLLENNTGSLYVALDRISDPQNAGAIARSIVAFGAAGMILPRKKSAPLGATALKVSAGALAKTRVCHVSGLANFLIKADQAGFAIVGLDLSGEPLRQFKKDFKNETRAVILVLGSEGQGLSRLVKERCHSLVTIEQGDQVESLNVASSASIALYELLV